MDRRRCHLGAARLARAPAVLDLPGRRRGGYWWLRRHEAVQAARQRRDEPAAWTARKAEWHRVAHLIGLGDFHLQKVTPTLLGEELLLTSAPGSDLASRVARNGDAIAEKYAHLEGLPYGRVDISTTEYPGQLVIGIRRVDPSVKGIVYHPLTTPWPSPEPRRTPAGSPPGPPSATRSRSGSSPRPASR